MDLEPDVVCLEQVAHIMKVDRTAVTDLITQLHTKYVVHSAIVNCWVYGDVSNRERLMIIRIHKKFGDMAHEYEIPRGDFHSGRAPHAWMVACEDAAPRRYQNVYGETTKSTTQLGVNRYWANFP